MERFTKNEDFKSHRTIEQVEADLAKIKREEVAVGLGEFTTQQLIDELWRRQREDAYDKPTGK